jgi:hypothetical protein
MKRIVHVLILAVLTLLLATPLVFAQSTQVTQTIQEVERETQDIRGLTEKEPIDVRFMTTKELEQMLLDDLNAEYTPEEWTRDENLLKLLGFLEENDKYYDIMLGLYTEQIAGFYDPEEKYLALISEDKEMSAMDRMNLSHEITHALQDQYYHLDEPPFDVPDSTNYDADFAATCLVEGDATLTMYQYEETFTTEDYADLMKESGNIESTRFDAAPKYIQDSLLFPYQQGMVFANRLYDRNSFTTIDNAYSNPPVSSEQVMHPEKYLAGEMPMQVSCPDIASSLGEGWELADTNVIGEFDLQELLMTELRTTDADKGAAGWGGCQYRLFTNPDTGKNLIAIDIKWDNEAEAKEFAGLYEEYIDKRFGLEKGSYDMNNGWAVWDTGKSGSAALSLKGNETFVVFSTDKNAVSDAATALGASGGNLGGVLESQPELEGRVDKKTSSSNWLVFVIVLGMLVLGLILVVVFLLINRKERAAQAVVYPAYRQQPPWPPQPPYPPYPGQIQHPWPPPQPPGLQYPQQQVWPPQPPVAPQTPEPGEGPTSQEEGPVEYS